MAAKREHWSRGRSAQHGAWRCSGNPLLPKERLELVGRDAAAGAHRPLPASPPKRGVMFMEGSRLGSGPRETEGEDEYAKKMLKIGGTNSTSPLESIKTPKNELKTNWFLSAKKGQTNSKMGQKTTFCAATIGNTRLTGCRSEDNYQGAIRASIWSRQTLRLPALTNRGKERLNARLILFPPPPRRGGKAAS